MARIQVDFDEVMRFADLHGDIARSIDARRGVFRIDAARIDTIVVEYGLHRPASGFPGSLASAMAEADARAGRVAQTLLETSTRILRHAGSISDDSFNWLSAVWADGAIRDFSMELLESAGDFVADRARRGRVLGQSVSPALKVLGPFLMGATGVLDIIDGAYGVVDATAEGWDRVASVVQVVSGSVFAVVGGTATALFIAGGAGAAALLLTAASPFVIAAAIIGLGAVIIEHRHRIARMVRPLVEGAREHGGDLLRGALPFAFVPAAFPLVPVGLAGLTLSLLERESSALAPRATSDESRAPVRLPGGPIGPDGTLQGSAPNLQGSSPHLQGPGSGPVGPTPSPAPPSPPWTPGPQPISNSDIAAAAEREIAADRFRYRGQVGDSKQGECMVAMSRWLKSVPGGVWRGSEHALDGYERVGATSIPVEDLRRGDVVQRVSVTHPRSYIHAHTMVVLSVDPHDPSLMTVAESNHEGPGVMGIRTLRLADHLPPGTVWTGWRFGERP
jgi:hypothetical protein